MLNTIRLIVLLLTLVFFPLGAEAGKGDVRYTKARPLVYEDSWNLWPYVYINQDGKPDGFNIDLLKSILNRLDIPYVVRLRPSILAREALQRDSADLTIGMRKDYNTPFGQFGKSTIIVFTNSILLPKRDSITHVSQEDLYGMRFYVHQGSLSHHYLSRHGYDYAMTPLENMAQVSMDIATQDSGMVLWNTMSLKYLKRKYNLDNFKLLPVDIPDGEYRFMSNDPKLLHKLDSTLEAMREDKSLDAIINKWFYPEKIEDTMPLEWRIALGMVILFFVTLVVAGIIFFFRRRKARRELRDTINQLTLVLHANRIKVWIFNPVTRKFSWLDREGNTDKQYSSFEFSLFYPQDEFEKVNNIVNSFLNHEKDHALMEIKGYNLGDVNEVLHLELSLGVLKDDYNHIKFVFGVQRDITDEVAKLRQKREIRYMTRSLFYNNLFCTYKFDEKGDLISLNGHACQLMGVKNAEEATAKGINIHALGIFTDDNLQFGMPVEGEILVRQDDEKTYSPFINAKALAEGETVHYTVWLCLIKDDKGDAFCYLMRVIDTSRFYHVKQSMEGLRNELKILEKKRDVASGHFDYSLDVGGRRLIYYNVETKMLYNSQTQNAKDMVLSQLDLISTTHPDDLPKLIDALRKMDAKCDERLTNIVRVHVHYSSDPYRILQYDLHPHWKENHELTYYVGILTDITDKVRTQESLERESALAKETDQLKQKFINNMTHRVRTPLVKIRRCIRSLAETDVESRERTLLSSISVNSSRLLSLMDDTLFLSCLDAGIVTPRPALVDFNSLFAVAFYKGKALHDRVDVEYVLEEGTSSHTLPLDSDLISRIVTNLVICFTRHLLAGAIHARYIYRFDKLSIMVESPDFVLEENALQDIFKPKVTDDTIVAGDQSSGLEMAIVKSIVDLLQGSIDVYSKQQNGTSVLVAIPIRG